jgi:signal transduction histidine kinase
MLRVAEHFERTDTGRQRRGNEDAYFARSPLFAVADGVGGAQAGGGSGLRGLADRVAALQGTLRVESHGGSGTVVSAAIPVGAVS